MKKFIISFLLLTCIFLSSCSFLTLREPTTSENNPVYATDVNGVLVPVHENVSESSVDPKSFFKDENGRICYEDASMTLLTGIDVSVFQGDINWEKVKNDGIDFVMLRLGFRGYGTKGIIQTDNNFYKNYDGALQAGLKIGVYFYSQATDAYEAREEAEYVLSVLGERKLDFPIAYDWEYVDAEGARTNNMTSEQITLCASAFCDRIKLSGRNVIIYFNREIGYFEYDLTVLDEYDFWLAEYFDYPSFIYDYKMWQYTDKGIVDGINGAVDLNISLIDYSEESFG